MKISLIGNCQLEVLGNLIKKNKEYFDKLQIEVVWNTPLYKLRDEHLVNLFRALEDSDVIFHQFYGEQWKNYSTKNINKYFDIKILPTLESLVSSPQLAYWGDSTPIPPSYIYIDYRFLQLFLENKTPFEAAELYTDVNISHQKLEALIDKQAKHYKNYYFEKKVISDYSEFFYIEIQKNHGSYSTISHPNNNHLTWLLQEIVKHTGRENKISIQGPDLLKNTIVPKLGSKQKDYQIINKLSLPLAAKIYFNLYSSFDKDFLKRQFINSNYANLIEHHRINEPNN